MNNYTVMVQFSVDADTESGAIEAAGDAMRGSDVAPLDISVVYDNGPVDDD